MKLHLLKFFLTEFLKRKKKTNLITFAIAWGALSLLLMMAFGNGMTKQFLIGFRGVGDNLVTVYGGATSMEYQGLPKGRRINLSYEDVKVLQNMIPESARISPESFADMDLTYKNTDTSRTARGIFASYGIMRNVYPQKGGRFISEDDVTFSRRVVFLGWKLKEHLFKDEDAIGKKILINRVPFKVIGISQKKLQSSYNNGLEYDQLYMPISTLMMINSQYFLGVIYLQPTEIKNALLVENKVKAILGKKYRFDKEDKSAIQINNMATNNKTVHTIFLGIEIFLTIVGGLTLFAAAVGVTNLMYAVVRERTREIGIKMAMGAKRRYIVFQFLLEALFIFTKGTAWGFLIAFNIVNLVRLIPLDYSLEGIFTSYFIRPEFSMSTLLVFIGIMGTLVFLAGIFPALRAARLNPVDALHYE